MTIAWHDVTIPMRPGMTVWPGDRPFSFEPASRTSDGDSCNTSYIALPTHAGTHCDAPWHFMEDGKKLDAVDSAVFFGPARLIACPEVDTVHAADLGAGPLPARIILQTRNAAIPYDAPFQENFVGVAEDAARRMVAEGVRMVGVDYLSVAPYKEARPTHEVLLGNEVFVVEGLRLGGFAPGDYEFVVLPMHLAGADGAPCRAFLGMRGQA